MVRRLSPQEVHRRQRTMTGKLTELEVARIKRLLQIGESKRQLAQAFDVSLWTIRAIARGDIWGWVLPDTYELPADATAGLPPISPEMAAAADASAERLRKMLGLTKDLGPDPSVMDRMLTEAQVQRDKDKHTDDLLNELGDSSDKQETTPASETQGEVRAAGAGPEGPSADGAPAGQGTNRYF